MATPRQRDLCLLSCAGGVRSRDRRCIARRCGKRAALKAHVGVCLSGSPKLMLQAYKAVIFICLYE